MNSLSDNTVSPEEYLAQERVAETKNEYYDGEVRRERGALPDSHQYRFESLESVAGEQVPGL